MLAKLLRYLVEFRDWVEVDLPPIVDGILQFCTLTLFVMWKGHTVRKGDMRSSMTLKATLLGIALSQIIKPWD